MKCQFIISNYYTIIKLTKFNTDLQHSHFWFQNKSIIKLCAISNHTNLHAIFDCLEHKPAKCILPASDKRAYWLFVSYTLLSWASGIYLPGLCSKQSNMLLSIWNCIILVNDISMYHTNHVTIKLYAFTNEIQLFIWRHYQSQYFWCITYPSTG